MTYIRSLSQADWFFKPEGGDLRPGGLTPLPAAPPPTAAGATPDAAPVDAGAATPPPPAAGPPTTPPPTAGPPPAPSAEPVKAGDKDMEEDIPVLEEKEAPYGLYLLGGIGAIVLGIFLYKKYGKKEEVKVVKKAKPAITMTKTTTTTTETTKPTAAEARKAKAKRKRKK